MAFTFFFRDMQTLERIVAHMIDEAAGKSRVAIWDAGCAMGQEPYSLAILFAEKMGRFAFKNLHIDATDIDSSDLFAPIITQGVYPNQELGRIPAAIYGKYFHPAAREGFSEIDYSIRSRVSFRRHNLLTLEAPGRNYMLILCKNVLLHFSQKEREDVIRMFHGVLAPGGFLAMEQTQKLPGAVEHLFVQATPDCQLFRKIDDPKDTD